MGHAYAQKAAAVAEAVSTSDLRSTLLEDQCKLLAHAVRASPDPNPNPNPNPNTNPNPKPGATG